MVGSHFLGGSTLGHCSWKRRSFLEEEEEEDRRMRRGFHGNLFILSLYLSFSLFFMFVIPFSIMF